SVGAASGVGGPATDGGGTAAAASAPTARIAAATKTGVDVKRVGARNGGLRTTGAVLIRPHFAAKPEAGLHDIVELKLYRRSHGRWHAISRARRTRLTPHGHFKKRLRTFRHHRLHRGIYRVQARYPGSRGATPSASHSPMFKIRT